MTLASKDQTPRGSGGLEENKDNLDTQGSLIVQSYKAEDVGPHFLLSSSPIKSWQACKSAE